MSERDRIAELQEELEQLNALLDRELDHCRQGSIAEFDRDKARAKVAAVEAVLADWDDEPDPIAQSLLAAIRSALATT